jgi:UDP-N-acetylglucosamine--N-acetylmuramyl-(pentapeptide) pyrophosphoryl-undecaprenol N-acetylglucosamine transferase
MLRHRIALTGGGTGGHIYPALAVAEQLQNDPEVESIVYIGAKGHPEERLARENKLDFIGLNVSGMPRKLSPKLLAWPWQTLGAVIEARKILRLFRPTAVLGTGGYASAPPLAAAVLSSVPFAIHEPDSNPGLVNRLFASYANLCSLGMAAAKPQFESMSKHVIVNGNPLRGSFLEPLSRPEAAKTFALAPDRKTLLVTGGSQGAQAINDALAGALPRLLADQANIQVLHQVGEKNIEAYRARLPAELLNHDRYCLRAYIDDLSMAYAVSDVTICRAGAMTIAELLVMNTPAIFIPYPFAAQDHQMHNGRFMESKGCAVVIPQAELNAEKLADVVLSLFADGKGLLMMKTAMQAIARPTAAHDIARQLKEIGSSRAVDAPV